MVFSPTHWWALVAMVRALVVVAVVVAFWGQAWWQPGDLALCRQGGVSQVLLDQHFLTLYQHARRD